MKSFGKYAIPRAKDSTPKTHPNATMERREIVCPAGLEVVEKAIAPACHCRIEDSIVSSRYDPTSYKVWCTGDYKQCPTWRSSYDKTGSR